MTRSRLTHLAPTRLLAAVLLVGVAAPARAQTPTCDQLTGEAKKTATAALARLHPYAGCDATFAECLARPPHPAVVRPANDLCRLAQAGKTGQELEQALRRRAQSLLPLGKPAAILLDEAFAAGEARAPITVVVYACGRCPYCAVLVPALYNQVTYGNLAGKVRLFFRTFPLKDHPGALEAGLGFVSAAKLGRFWPFALRLYVDSASFDAELLPEWAAGTGIESAAFAEALADPATRAALVAAKQEGVRNKVEATPTLFIDGRKYVYESKEAVIIDVLLEAFESRPGASP